MLASVFLLPSCGQQDPPEAVSEWRLLISLPEIDLPVHLHLAPDGSEAWFTNGAERVVVPDVSRQGETWILHFPTFKNTLRLEQHADTLAGTLTLVKRGYEQVMPVTGAPDPGYRFSGDPRPAVDVTGRWEVRFTEDDGTESFAIGEFDQQGSTVAGTFLTPKGDYRYLAGEVDGQQLRLSTFDGAHAFVFTATAQPDATLQGDFWSGTKWHESWVAQKNFDVRLPDAYALTFIKDGYDGLEFSFPDLSGRPVSLADDKYRGKVVLVTLSGTWCPNCADEVAFLSGYFKEHHERGLEIITLLYEHFDDFKLAAQQGIALVNEHAIDYDVLIAGVSDKDLAAETLPMLNHVLAFPTMIFIDRAGKVRGIHTGFSGPGTGDHYTRFVQEFHQQMEQLLSEPAPGVEHSVAP